MKQLILLINLFTVLSTVEAQTAKTAKVEIPLWKIHQLDSAIRNAEGPTIFNFWATFCAPCIAVRHGYCSSLSDWPYSSWDVLSRGGSGICKPEQVIHKFGSLLEFRRYHLQEFLNL